MSVGRVHHGGTPIDDPQGGSDTSASSDSASTPHTSSTSRGTGTRADVVARVTASTTGSTPTALQLIDGAKTRIRMKLADLKDTTLLQHLKDASLRGVDVQVYMVAPKKFDGKMVLDEQGLELSGVDTTVDKTDKLPDAPTIVADDQALVAGAGGKLTLSKDRTAISKAVGDFAKAVAEKVSAGTGGPRAGGVNVVPMPDSGVGDVVDEIARAKKTLDLECYQVDDPVVNAALVAAAKRGVKVRVMLEPKTVGAKNYEQESKLLQAAGIEVKPTPPQFDSHRNVDHAKFMVIDGKELCFGSGNLVRSGLGGNPAQEFDNRDVWVEDGRAASATEGQKLFDADWDRKSTTGIEFKNLVVTPDNADKAILDLIGAAKKRCYVSNQSLNDPAVITALIAAKRRGADVQVLLGFQPGFGPPPNQAAITQLKAAGIPADYLKKNYLHAKVIVSDDKAFIGSQNFTNGGLNNNRELGEIIDDAAGVKKLVDTFKSDAGG